MPVRLSRGVMTIGSIAVTADAGDGAWDFEERDRGFIASRLRGDG
jgi:hypothetical protein